MKVHFLDSIGSLFPSASNIWSNKNKKSPFDIKPSSRYKAIWKCSEGHHNEYERSIKDSVRCGFRCPKCQFSKGEKRIEEWLIKNNIEHESQVTYDGLVGLGNGLLSYDFYLSEFNLLIEYQGEFHDGSGNEYTRINLKQQQEHDRRKQQYTIDNNIKLLEIWYWDYDNIGEILNKNIMNELN